jgi:uncharacterized protein with HEPN domain
MRPESRSALIHVLEAAREIRSVTAGKTIAEYEADRHLRAIVERYFITIGEALSRVSRHDPDLFRAMPQARSIVGFRNVLVHGYDVVDEEQVWAAITDELEYLIATAEGLLDE